MDCSFGEPSSSRARRPTLICHYTALEVCLDLHSNGGVMSRARLGPFPRALHEARSFFQEPRVFDFGSITIHSEEGMDRRGICC